MKGNSIISGQRKKEDSISVQGKLVKISIQQSQNIGYSGSKRKESVSYNQEIHPEVQRVRRDSDPRWGGSGEGHP